EIRFDLPDTRLVRLEIYDLLGRKVRSLLNSTMETGEHRVEWDGRNSQGEMQPSGVYFYRISAGDFRETRKMMMLK
ncbi:MAG: FlgD immunoglobulin-like domain containing protein, partial [Candidatus Krumholzibacteria bacterium]|nr:FlgD immunoglobulin-like domain containing protein [Candidatus Krumholzibacteria bacterium]